MPDGNRRPVVWIVDDSPTERSISERSLGSAFEFVHFADGAEVVERLGEGGSLPDLVLLDWVMPGMSGDEVCRFVRSHEATRALPIILVTATRVETEDVVAGLTAGANDYVARPFVPEELRARVDAILRNKQLADAAHRERTRLDTINDLGRALFSAGTDMRRILEVLATVLTERLCDGCAVMLLPGVYPEMNVVRHRASPGGAALASIACIADPAVLGYQDDEHALAALPPAYHAFIRRFGLRGLGILPFPTLAPVQGVVTVTRERGSRPFADEDIHTITTCIEYASLAVQNALRFENERQSRAQLDALFAHAPFGIVVTEVDGILRMVNPAAAALLPGIDRARDLHALYRLTAWRGADGEPLDEATWRARWWPVERGVSVDLVAEVDGGPRVLNVWTVPLSDGAVALGRLTSFADVSAARQVAADRDRMAAFQQQLIGIASHDLRNPLGALTTGLAVLEMRGDELPDLAPLVRRMRSAATRMTSMIDQLLDVTRARLGGGIPVVLRRVSLTQIARQVVDELSLARSTAEIQLAVEHDIDGVWDPDRLSQVIANLLANASQYGRPGAPIRVEVGGDDLDGVLVVSNATAREPISAERLQTIFDPYARGSEASSRNVRGLGLGLYIVSE
ncbi:MAG TPA: response regulator, partial [Kofleriaceae bacterium]|nr:response regulator [Kofleriaceae bacterium]